MNKFLITLEINNSPLDQFEIRDFITIYIPILNNINLSFTNIGMYILIATFISIIVLILSNNLDKIIFNN